MLTIALFGIGLTLFCILLRNKLTYLQLQEKKKSQTPLWPQIRMNKSSWCFFNVPLKAYSITLTTVQSNFHLLWKQSRLIMCSGACRVLEHSSNSNVLPISSWYYFFFMGSVFVLTLIFLLYHQSFSHPLWSPLVLSLSLSSHLSCWLSFRVRD